MSTSNYKVDKIYVGLLSSPATVLGKLRAVLFQSCLSARAKTGDLERWVAGNESVICVVSLRASVWKFQELHHEWERHGYRHRHGQSEMRVEVNSISRGNWSTRRQHLSWLAGGPKRPLMRPFQAYC